MFLLCFLYISLFDINDLGSINTKLVGRVMPMESNADNPLFVPQREVAGAETYVKYKYQYNWALYRVIKKHADQNEYAVFVELHEDVVVADSFDPDKATFEFNQIKTTKKTFTETELIKVTKNKPQSVLGKLLTSANQKDFINKIGTINLVSVHGFNLKQKVSGARLELIKLDDIEEDSIKQLTAAIKKEIGQEKLPANLQFVIPDLSEKKFENDVIAEISRLISFLSPGSRYDPMDIYRILIDELNRKGTVVYDYKKWNELLNKKALTSTTVTRVINQFTSTKNESQIEQGFSDIVSEIRLNVVQRNSLKKAFDRYRTKRIGNRSTTQIEITKTIKNAIDQALPACNENIQTLIEIAYSETEAKLKRHFVGELDLRGAIICEYILEHL